MKKRGDTLKENKFIDCSSGVNPLGPSNKVKAALRKAVKKINNSPYIEMKQLQRLFESKFGITPDNMLFANSLKELIYLIPEVLNPKRVLIVGPALDIYEDAAQLSGAEVSYINAAEADGFVFDMSCILKNLKNIDLVFLAAPNRVTGKMIPREKLLEIMTVLPKGGPHFVIDEALIEFASVGDSILETQPASLMIHKSNFTILRTTAYFYGMPGLELAYAVSSPEVIQLYEKKKHWDINLLSVEAARAAFKDTTYRKASRQYTLLEKKAMIRLLNKIEGIRVYDTDTNIILVKLDNNPEEVTQKLRRAGFGVRDCGEIKGLDRSFFRISVLKHENNLKLISALKRFYQIE